MAKEVQVYDTPSGLGGSFNVSILSKDEGTGDLLCRIWYGRLGFYGWEPSPDFDGHTVTRKPDQLSNPRKLQIAT